ICRVAFAWHVLGVDLKAAREGANKLANSLETFVGLAVSVPPVMPTFDDSSVVSEEYEAALRERDRGDGIDEELEGNGFRPADVSLSISGFPIRG
ncbi:hypothetical protein F5887DRAFT_901024, partial [Amanita rubescens]